MSTRSSKRGFGVIAGTVALSLMAAMTGFVLVIHRSLAIQRVDAWFVSDRQAEEAAHSAFDEAAALLMADRELERDLTSSGARYEREIQASATRGMFPASARIQLSPVSITCESYSSATPDMVGLPTSLATLSTSSSRSPSFGSGLLRFKITLTIGRTPRTYSACRMFSIATVGSASDASGLTLMAQDQFWERGL